MKSNKLLILLAVLITASFAGVNGAFAQEKMKYEDYLIELQKWQDRETKANEQIAVLNQEIADLKRQIASTENETRDTYSMIYRTMNTTEQGFRQYINQLNMLTRQVRSLLNLSPGELVKKEDEINRVKTNIDEMKSRPEAKHPEAKPLLSEIDSLFARLLSAYNRALETTGGRFDVYTVDRGDHLWKIAKKPDIYNDPFQWMKIYTKNRDLISNPNVIHPGQDLKIFRSIARNEYEVKRGDFLYKIAGFSNVYGDPTQWNKIYDANKSVIADPNVIYPYMVLIFPDK